MEPSRSSSWQLNGTRRLRCEALSLSDLDEARGKGWAAAFFFGGGEGGGWVLWSHWQKPQKLEVAGRMLAEHDRSMIEGA